MIRHVIACCLLSTAFLFSATGGTDLRKGFLDPPHAAKPWCYWWWSNGNVDRETITADIEAMKRLGFGALLMVDSRGYWDKDDDHVPNPPVKLVWGSEAWYDHVEFAIRECARVGLEFTMNAAASGGTLNGFKDGKAYEVDIMDRDAVVAHLDRAIGPLLKRVGNLVGTTFTHIYSVSYEGNVRKDASWRQIKDTFYATMRQWAHDHGLKVFSESGGPWAWSAAEKAFAGADQLQMLEFNDFPQGEYWVGNSWGLTPQAGHANANGRFFTRGVVLAARQNGCRIASAEAFTHMLHHWSVDPALLKPLADQAFADGINRLVWHTFSCSPKSFGIPGVEYFAGSHVNRNVTWHDEAAAFVKYLGRCQYLLQQGEYVNDGEFDEKTRAYYGWGRGRKNPSEQFTWTHRRTADTDIFFIAGEGKGEVTLNAAAPSVELWDAVTGTITPAKAERVDGGKTKVALDLPTGGSVFVVFGAKCVSDSVTTAPSPSSSIVTGPWKVEFAYHPGVTAVPPRAVEMTELVDFTTRDDLRHFAGTATYRTKFDCGKSAAGEKVVLSLGTVPSGLAHVYVNGTDCGTVWCAPWEADVTAAVREGANELEIRYVNNWHNRLVGDCQLPPEERVTRSNVRYWTKPRKGDWKNSWSLRPTVYSGPSVNDPLQRSGLLGPVSVVRFGRQVVSGKKEGAKAMKNPNENSRSPDKVNATIGRVNATSS